MNVKVIVIATDHPEVGHFLKTVEVGVKGVPYRIGIELRLPQRLQHRIHHAALAQTHRGIDIVFRVVDQLRRASPGAVALVIPFPVGKELPRDCRLIYGTL